MNTSFKKTRRIVAAIALTTIATAITASAQTQQNNQLALQLGAIQLGYTTNNSWTTNPQLLANALTQGQQALLATTTNKYTSYVGSTNAGSTNLPPTNAPVAQSENFRAELLQATLAALESPITYTNKVSPAIPVTVVNGKTGKQTTNKVTALGFNPALTTPTAVLAIVSARIPNFDPSLISNAVAATMMTTSGTNTNGVLFPVWGPQPAKASVTGATTAQKVLTLNEKTIATQLNNSAAVAKAALAAAVKAYTAGTKQWAAVPKTGPASNSVYLPNFSDKPIGPTGNPQAINLTGLSDAAGAVAANAINGLGAVNTNSPTTTAGLYGQTASNVTIISKALTQAANAVQATSIKTSPNYASGALGAAELGLTTQVSGTNDESWGGQASTNITTKLLNGIVKGAVQAVGVSSANLAAIATGIAQGFAITYLETSYESNVTPVSISQFTSDNLQNSAILNAFIAAGVKSISIEGKISAALSSGVTQVYNAFNYSGTNSWTYNGILNPTYTISGAKGLSFSYTTNTVTPLLNGVGTPVTDTTGL